MSFIDQKETIQKVIDQLRLMATLHVAGNVLHRIADELQFGVKGRDPTEGTLCVFCMKDVKGIRTHRCW